MDEASLPTPVARWVEAAGLRDLGQVRTLGLAGTGRVRIGPLPWLPIDHRTVHRLGRDQVRDIRLRVGPVPVLTVLDAYVDGAGMTKIGPFPSIGPEIDQGAYLARWAEAIAWPAAWSEADGLSWEPVDEHHARLHLPFGDGVEVIDVAFDPVTAYPHAFEVDRFQSKGRKVRWRAECFDLKAFGEIRAWSRVAVTWADDGRPWYEGTFDRVEVNVPVDDAIERARRAIDRARGRRRP